MGPRVGRDLADQDHLWRLLCAITLTKIRQQARFHGRQKRTVQRERWLGDTGLQGWDAPASQPTPAEAGYRHARETVDRFYTQVSEDTLLNQHGMQPLRRELLQQALAYYQQFIRERSEAPALQDDPALTYYRVGRITEQVDSPDQSLAAYRRALELQERLVQHTPADPQGRQALGDTWNALGGVLAKRGDLEEAHAAYGQAATS